MAGDVLFRSEPLWD